MWIIRPVVATDVDALFDLAEKLGSGMTTFPANRDTLAQKVDITRKITMETGAYASCVHRPRPSPD